MKDTNRAGGAVVARRLYTADVSPVTARDHERIKRSTAPVYKHVPVGTRYSRWVVVGVAPKRDKHYRWIVRCDCGREADRQAESIRTGRSSQCNACQAREVAALRRLPVPTKGADGKQRREYKAYQSMLARCYDERTSWYHRYGGRGIGVCDRWRESFAAFVADMGPCPAGYSLDRIDNDGDYGPGNCRWATAKQQARNTRRNRVLELDGRSQCVAAWAEERGIKPQAIFTRLRRGWSVRDAIYGRE